MLNNKNSAAIMLAAFGVLILILFYIYLLSPKKEEATVLRGSIIDLNQEIAELQVAINSIEESEQETEETLLAIRKKLPVDKAIASLLLDIEKTGTGSNAKISNIQFNHLDAPVNQSNLLDPNTLLGVENLDDGTKEEMGLTAEEAPKPSIALESLPPQLQMITFNLAIETNSEQEMLEFIKQLEKTERILKIDSVSFRLPGEEENRTAANETIIQANLQVTAFYYLEE